MKIAILNSALEAVEFREGDVLEELVADIPEGHTWIPVPNVEVEADEGGQPIPATPVMTKVAFFNAKGYPINVIAGAEHILADMILMQPPTHKALTLKGTQWEAVEMAGDLLSYDDMVASLTPASET